MKCNPAYLLGSLACIGFLLADYYLFAHMNYPRRDCLVIAVAVLIGWGLIAADTIRKD